MSREKKREGGCRNRRGFRHIESKRGGGVEQSNRSVFNFLEEEPGQHFLISIA